MAYNKKIPVKIFSPGLIFLNLREIINLLLQILLP